MRNIVGGRNIGNEYFGAVSHAEFSDLDVLSLGPIVQDVSAMFDAYWNSAAVVPAAAFAQDQPFAEEALVRARAQFAKKIQEFEAGTYVAAIHEEGVLSRIEYESMPFFWGRAVLLYDNPAKVTADEISAETHLAPNLGAYIQRATEEVDIISPYFVPGDQLVEYLGELTKKGLRVRILTNSLAANDVGVVHAGYMRYRIALLKNGVELYEFKSTRLEDEGHGNKKWMGSSNASLHAKTFAIDRRLIFVGSFNLDPRSVALNTEMGVLFESPEMLAAVMGDFEQSLAREAYRLELVTIPPRESPTGFERHRLKWVSLEGDKKATYDTEPETSFWQRFAAGFLSIFVIESYL